MGLAVSPQESVKDGVIVERSGGLAIVRLGGPGEKTVIMTERRLESLGEAIDGIVQDKTVAGVVFCGPGSGAFCSGIDVRTFAELKSAEEADTRYRRGQEVFGKLAQLKCRTVAAISGACIGAGLDLALACNHRLALNVASTRLGYAEMKLGMISGFGGTQRLPRLVGYETALEMIVDARMLSAEEALECGLVDRLVSGKLEEMSEDDLQRVLMSEAFAVALGNLKLESRKMSVWKRFETFTSAGRGLGKRRLRGKLESGDARNFAAPVIAAETVARGLARDLDFGLLGERRAAANLAVSPEARALMHLYFASEESSKLGKALRHRMREAKIGVCGAGMMGCGIAASFLGAGHQVTVVEPSSEVRSAAQESLRRAVERRGISAAEGLQALELRESMEGVEDCDVIIEAIVEDLGAKQDFLRELSGRCREDALLATNTMTLSISELAQSVAHPNRFVGLHFLNPADRMQLVEVVRGASTDDRSVLAAAAIAARLNKYPVVVEDRPGFLVGRLLSAYFAEASHLLSEGYSIAEIDRAALAVGMLLGPLRLADEVGLDVVQRMKTQLESELGERFRGCGFSEKLLAKGRLGRRSKRGFYRYEGGEIEPDSNIREELSLPPVSVGAGVAGNPAERLILAVINEAVRCLDEGLAGIPGEEAAGQIDLGSVMGLGFPTYKGGILFYADGIGVKPILAKLESYEKKLGSRFKPAEQIRTRAERGLRFRQKV